MPNNSNRRKFLGTAAGAAAFTILPRRLLARSGEVPPSDKITLAYIGTGTQGLRELLPLLAAPEIRVVSVCDPSKHALGYRDWARDSQLPSPTIPVVPPLAPGRPFRAMPPIASTPCNRRGPGEATDTAGCD